MEPARQFKAMIPNQTSPDSLHPPVIAGVPTGGESRGIFDSMKSYKFPSVSKIEVYVTQPGFVVIICDDGPIGVVLQSKERVIEVANALLSLAEVATFKPEEKD